MRSIQSWLDEYNESHQSSFNKLVHWICVPAIMFSLLGLFWTLQTPALFNSLPLVLNWAVVLILLALIFYFMLSIKLALGMVLVAGSMLYLINWIDSIQTPLWILSMGIFIIAWIGQFIGHIVEGKKPSFIKDLQFLLIGPLWLLAFIYRKLGINY